MVDCFRKHRLLNILKGKVFCTDLISVTKFTQWSGCETLVFPTSYIDVDFIDIDTDIGSIRHNPFHCCLLCHMSEWCGKFFLVLSFQYLEIYKIFFGRVQLSSLLESDCNAAS